MQLYAAEADLRFSQKPLGLFWLCHVQNWTLSETVSVTATYVSNPVNEEKHYV